jgi:hypothetical protein
MKTEYGVKAISLPRYFAKIPFASLLVSLLKSVILFVKEIAKTPSVRVFFPLMESLLYALLLAIQRPIYRNFGSYNALSMAFDTVLATGMTKLMQFSDPLDLLHLLKTLAFTWVLFMISLLHLVQN